jgi:hypothetical protein
MRTLTDEEVMWETAAWAESDCDLTWPVDDAFREGYVSGLDRGKIEGRGEERGRVLSIVDEVIGDGEVNCELRRRISEGA